MPSDDRKLDPDDDDVQPMMSPFSFFFRPLDRFTVADSLAKKPCVDEPSAYLFLSDS